MGRIFEKRKESIFKTAAQKSKLYAKYGKKLYMAAKNGVADPEANPALRSVVEKAKRENVPSHVIEKAIQKAGGAGGEDFHLVRYEGFGPGGALVIVDCLTDNNQRTISEIRNCFTKTGSKLAANGSVAMSFDHVAVLSFKGDNEEQVMEALFGRTSPSKMSKAKMATLRSSPHLPSSTKPRRPFSMPSRPSSWIPRRSPFFRRPRKTLSAEDLAQFEKFLEMLHDCDDVQDIYHNVTFPS